MIIENFEIVSFYSGNFIFFQKMRSGNLSQITLPNMWLLILIFTSFYSGQSGAFKLNINYMNKIITFCKNNKCWWIMISPRDETFFLSSLRCIPSPESYILKDQTTIEIILICKFDKHYVTYRKYLSKKLRNRRSDTT